MKVTRLTSFWDAEQVITVIEMLDELKESLLSSYHLEIEQHRQQQWQKQLKEDKDNLDLFDDRIDF